ncbi:ADP-ribosylglycohydrolase family protein [Candidatus Pristimantibacillus sp. PTI5]|uniref:ADP-ribosylglycohydrolase family protein n=1 Tax=Candidatus Pristimantibacillus sp. PTI5 TaxID=3400422 RepID=UPI003B0181DC
MKASEQYYLSYSHHFDIERQQSIDEGKNIGAAMEASYAKLASMQPDDPQREEMAAAYLDEMARQPLRADFPFAEPSTLPEIQKERLDANPTSKQPIPQTDLADKVYGAWLGRSAGCLLGQPIEGWRKDRIAGLLKETGNFPVHYYISSEIDPEIAKKYGVTNEGGSYGNDSVSWINNVKHMVEDDDMNYTIIGLAVVEKYGYNYSPDDVAETWLNLLPLLRTCTAERIAYRNLVNRMDPPHSAAYRNVYREWIGAQIRVDLYGYINPGNPVKAAEMAWRDASISHVKNGIFGAMWVAAMLAAAAVTDNRQDVIQAGLGQIPSHCRLAGDIRSVLQWYEELVPFDTVVERIHHKYDESNPHHWCHTISNAMIVAASLLYGEGELEATIGLAVLSGFDTDCNAATAGSIIGMQKGARALPEKWVKPLNDKIRSGVDGFGIVPLSQLAGRTMKLIKNNPYIEWMD